MKEMCGVEEVPHQGMKCPQSERTDSVMKEVHLLSLLGVGTGEELEEMKEALQGVMLGVETEGEMTGVHLVIHGVDEMKEVVHLETPGGTEEEEMIRVHLQAIGETEEWQGMKELLQENSTEAHQGTEMTEVHQETIGMTGVHQETSEMIEAHQGTSEMTEAHQEISEMIVVHQGMTEKRGVHGEGEVIQIDGVHQEIVLERIDGVVGTDHQVIEISGPEMIEDPHQGMIEVPLHVKEKITGEEVCYKLNILWQTRGTTRHVWQLPSVVFSLNYRSHLCTSNSVH